MKRGKDVNELSCCRDVEENKFHSIASFLTTSRVSLILLIISNYSKFQNAKLLLLITKYAEKIYKIKIY